MQGKWCYTDLLCDDKTKAVAAFGYTTLRDIESRERFFIVHALAAENAFFNSVSGATSRALANLSALLLLVHHQLRHMKVE